MLPLPLPINQSSVRSTPNNCLPLPGPCVRWWPCCFAVHLGGEQSATRRSVMVRGCLGSLEAVAAWCALPALADGRLVRKACSRRQLAVGCPLLCVAAHYITNGGNCLLRLLSFESCRETRRDARPSCQGQLCLSSPVSRHCPLPPLPACGARTFDPVPPGRDLRTRLVVARPPCFLTFAAQELVVDILWCVCVCECSGRRFLCHHGESISVSTVCDANHPHLVS